MNRLTQRLREWTGQFWAITVNANVEGEPTMRDARTAEVMAHPLVKRALELFPDAEITAIRDIRPAIEPVAEAPDETDEDEE